MTPKKTKTKIRLASIFLCCVGMTAMAADKQLIKVSLQQPQHGRLTVSPMLPENGMVEVGTELTVSADVENGYAIDSVYHAVPGPWGPYYIESMAPVHKFQVEKESTISALFLPATEIAAVETIHDIVYAKPGVKVLKYDIFKAKDAKNLPIVVIIHGGGWRANTEDIMRGMARRIAETERYVVVSIDYRWLGTEDGDKEANSMADLIGDVFGALAHIQEHAHEYGGDPTRIAVTGDSAGGHLSAVAATMIDKIGDAGFGKTAGVFEFLPSYLPAGKSAADVRNSLLAAIQAAAPSYGIFSDKSYGGISLQHGSSNAKADSSWAAAIAPIHFIPNVAERAVPHYLIRGTQDTLIKKEMVTDYADALRAKGQVVKHVEVEGANHAFFDWKPDQQTRDTFVKFGAPYIDDMVSFFDQVFYAE